MSGGAFDYNQHILNDIVESINDLIDRNGKKLNEEELKGLEFYQPDGWLDKYPEDRYHYKYRDNVIKEFKDATISIMKSLSYINRIDYLISGDDGEESFLRRLKEELNNIKIKEKEIMGSKKTLNNTSVSKAKDNVSDIEIFGDGDLFQLISKASSKKEGWMKSTKAMEVSNGCIVQVTTQQGDNIAEALTFVPGVAIMVNSQGNKYLH